LVSALIWLGKISWRWSQAVQWVSNMVTSLEGRMRLSRSILEEVET
jgi:hypothetical protein